MELWIRTQDKMRLVKPNRLAIKRDSRTIGEGDYYIYESQNSLRYGTYTTKERAIEVLDEIQYSMKNFAFAKKLNGLGEELDLIPNPILIYQMPEN